jgi:type VI secretion system FHA domain protein
MRGPSLTIGRGPENDVVLPDPDRLISKNHCAVEDQGGGNVVVIDFSTNGTFLNYGKVPLGRTPTPLNDGDVLTMGGYEFVVAITAARPYDPARDLAPVEQEQVSHGSADAAPDLMDLLDGSGGGKKVDFLDDLMGAEPPRGPSTVQRDDPIDELSAALLPGDEDPILGRGAVDPLDEFSGASARQHTPSVSDSFSAARRSSVIPDDWDDFLKPSGPAPRGGGASDRDDPFAPPPRNPMPAPRAALDLPPDAFEGLIPGQSVVPRPPPKPRVADPEPRDPTPEMSPFAAPLPSGRAASVVPPPPTPRPASVPPPAQIAPEPAPPPAAPPPRAAPAPAPAPPPAPVAAAPAKGGRSDAARAFLRGAGAEDVHISDEDLAATMERLGNVFRLMVEGVRDILMTRASIKGEFRMERTQISAQGNNPLKFALSGEHAVDMLVRPKAKGYMDAPTAAKEALDDIKAHEVAMVTGMQAAIKDVLHRLDPKGLEARVQGSGGIMGNRKAKLWEEYERLFEQLSRQAEDDFGEFFAKEFARAYQSQLERLK